MIKKYIIVVFVFLVIMTAGVLAYLNLRIDDTRLTDEEINAKFCHITADVRKTDVYCQNPELYRQHIRDQIVIQ